MKRQKMARIEDLEKARDNGETIELRCRVCWEGYSTDVGDYFWARPNYAFRCSCTRGRPGCIIIKR